ncbi:GAP family protein [uncultured Brevibacterium sp.]|uniref:GAP family protein n=1 Tax=uncultured Brevibacterium sp. TaxID=189678 RepID=UPI0025FEE88F|nr:GAP family protein [uncultured Brevibacterium sp.]
MSDFLPLAGLALVDSLSAGTLVIPIALIFMWRRVRVGLLGTYLATIATAYFGLGVALLLGFDAAVTRLSGVSETDWFRWVTLVLGAGLFVFGVFSPNPKKHTATQSAGAEVPEGRASRLSLSVTGMAGLALGAAVVEAATMLPYLGAMGIIQSMSFGFSGKVALIAGYCLIMILPAILVAVIAGAAGPAIFPRLERAMRRLEYEAKVTLLWIAAIVGGYMAMSSALRLGLIG